MSLRALRIRNCFCGVLMLFVNMGILTTSFSNYFPYFRELKGFTNTQVLLLTTVRSVFALISMAFSGQYFRLLDIRKGTILTFLLASFSFFLMAWAPSPVFYYIAAALFGLGYGVGGMIPASILLRRWYSEHSGTPIGIAATGSGIAGMIIPLTITYFTERFGLSAAFAAHAALILLLAFPLMLVTDHPAPGTPGTEAAENLTPKKDARADAGEVDAPEQETRADTKKVPAAGKDSVKNKPLPPRLIAGMLVMGILGFSPAAALPLLFRTTGHDMHTISLLMSSLGFFLIIGKILVGEYADHFGGKSMLRVFGGTFTLSMLLFCLTGRAGFAADAFALFLFALGASLASVGISVLASDFTEGREYSEVLKRFQFTYALGGLLTSTLAGMIADATGSYIPAFALFAVFGCFLVVLFLLEYRAMEKRAVNA